MPMGRDLIENSYSCSRRLYVCRPLGLRAQFCQLKPGLSVGVVQRDAGGQVVASYDALRGGPHQPVLGKILPRHLNRGHLNHV